MEEGENLIALGARPAQRAAEPQVAASGPLPAVTPWVGIGFAPDALRIVQVIHGAPAQRAGVHVGDQVMTLDGLAVTAPREFVHRIASAKVRSMRTKYSGLELTRTMTKAMETTGAPR